MSKTTYPNIHEDADIIAEEILSNQDFFSTASLSSILMAFNEFLPKDYRVRIRVEKGAKPNAMKLVINDAGPNGRDTDALGEQLLTTHIIRKNNDSSEYDELCAPLEENEGMLFTISACDEPDIPVVASAFRGKKRGKNVLLLSIWTGQQQDTDACTMH